MSLYLSSHKLQKEKFFLIYETDHKYSPECTPRRATASAKLDLLHFHIDLNLISQQALHPFKKYNSNFNLVISVGIISYILKNCFTRQSFVKRRKFIKIFPRYKVDVNGEYYYIAIFRKTIFLKSFIFSNPPRVESAF